MHKQIKITPISFYCMGVKYMIIKERIEKARANGNLEMVAMLEIAIQKGLISEDDRWDVDEESILNWWEEFKDELKRQGKQLRFIHSEGTWIITSKK